MAPTEDWENHIRFRSRIRRVWGHAAIFAWSDLISDRSRKLVGLQSPAACASDPNFENYNLFHAQSPDTGCGVHMPTPGVSFSGGV